jgi:CRP-like cAMP-binding protein
VERRIARTLVRLTRQLGHEHEGDDALIIDAPLSRQDLAELSGTTLYTVSRTLKAWERAGLLESERKQLKILRPHKLITIAEDLPEKDQH